MQVRDFMIMKVYTIKATDTVKDLLNILYSNRIGGVPVVDEQDQLIGMVSDGDILRYLSPKPFGFAGLVYIVEDGDMGEVLHEKLQTEVQDIMTKRNILSASPDDDFETAMRTLSKHHFKKLPVVNGAGRVVGVLSRGDIIHNLVAKMLND